jgi:hypothetical protein
MPRFTQGQKDAAADNQDLANYGAIAAAPFGFGIAFVPLAGPFIAGAAVVVGAALGVRAIKLGRIVRDPPDRSFRKPVRVAEPQFDLSQLGEEPFQVRAAAFAQANEKVGAICEAMVSSLERAMGAERAREGRYVAERLQEAGQLAEQLAAAFEFAIESNGPLRDAIVELERFETPALEKSAHLADVLPSATLAMLDRVGIPRGYAFGDLGLIEARGAAAEDPREAFVNSLFALEEGDRLYTTTLRRQLGEGSLFAGKGYELGGGTPFPLG